MGIAHHKQNFQDWLTQQWVILFGKKMGQKEKEWLLGPFGQTKGIGIKFINQLAEKEQLVIDNNQQGKGLIPSIKQLNLPEDALKGLSENVIDFYEKTTNYHIELNVKWNPFFKVFGLILNKLFSNRIEQLNVPIENIKDPKALKSEIFHLKDPRTDEIKRIIWLRAFQATGRVVYSGVYEICRIPSGQTCIKAVFPLPNGNATVILSPSVGKKGELILSSSGKKIGDSGFYFLLNDARGNLWTKYIKSFKDRLVVSDDQGMVTALQTLTLWNRRVLQFEYSLRKKSPVLSSSEPQTVNQ